MRRSASEIIRELEMRVARLEKQTAWKSDKDLKDRQKADLYEFERKARLIYKEYTMSLKSLLSKGSRASLRLNRIGDLEGSLIVGDSEYTIRTSLPIEVDGDNAKAHIEVKGPGLDMVDFSVGETKIYYQVVQYAVWFSNTRPKINPQKTVNKILFDLEEASRSF